MKRLILIVTILAAGLVLYAFRPSVNGMITGKIFPIGAAKTVWAISGTDSTRANILSGNFSISVKAGTYQVYAEAESPYKSASLDAVQVKEGSPTDVGQIKLEQ